MYLHIGRNQMLAERRIIGIFDLEITSQSKTTRAFLDRAQPRTKSEAKRS